MLRNKSRQNSAKKNQKQMQWGGKKKSDAMNYPDRQSITRKIQRTNIEAYWPKKKELT